MNSYLQGLIKKVHYQESTDLSFYCISLTSANVLINEACKNVVLIVTIYMKRVEADWWPECETSTCFSQVVSGDGRDLSKRTKQKMWVSGWVWVEFSHAMPNTSRWRLPH